MAWDVEGTKRKILDAATREFVAHGQHGTTIERIARRAGVNKERIYHYYGGMTDLFATVLREKVAEGAGAVLLPATGVDQVAEFEARLFDFNNEHSDLIRLLMWEALAFTDEVPDEGKRVAMYRRRTDELRAGQQSGVISDTLDADMLHLLLLSLVGYGALLPQVVRMITGDGHDARYRAAVVEGARRLTTPASNHVDRPAG